MRWLLPTLGGLLVAAGLVTADTPRDAKPTTVEVPYRLTDTLHVLVRAKINGKGPFNFIIDTGAPTLFVSTEVCKKLGVTADDDGWAAFDRFDVEGGVKLPKLRGRVEDPFQLEGMNGLGLAGVKLNGIIGYTVLAKFRIEYDFAKDTMTWTRLNFEPPHPVGLRGKGGAAGGLDALGGVMKFLGGLMGKKADAEPVLRGFLGAAFAEAEGKVRVKSVFAGGPADKAGLKAGDRVSRFQGKSVSSFKDIHRLAGNLPAGKPATITVERDSGSEEITMHLGKGL